MKETAREAVAFAGYRQEGARAGPEQRRIQDVVVGNRGERADIVAGVSESECGRNAKVVPP